MLFTSLSKLLLLPALVRTAIAQNATSSTSGACNNAASLCSKQYNLVTHLGSHDAPFLRDESTGFSTSGNQFYNTTVQLDAGVRLLSAQVYNVNGSWHLCHTSCDLLDAGTLSNWLSEIRDWMASNSNDVVTILLVNSDGATASDLASEYQAAGVVSYSYTPPSLTSRPSSWPTLQQLITAGTPLLTFVASLSSDTAYPYIMNEFNFIFENSYNNVELTDFSCTPDRPSEVSGNSQEAIDSGRMPLMNHFLYEEQSFGIQVPDVGNITTTNAPGSQVGMLGTSAEQCTAEYGQAPSFVLVDFFNVGPAIDTVDGLNGVTDPVGRRSVSSAILTESSGAAGMVRVTIVGSCLVGAAMLVMGVA